MKKILSLLITFVLCLFVFAGCANPNANDSKDQNTDTEQQNEEMHVSGKDEYTEFSGIFLTIESVESSKDARGNEYRIYTLRWHNQSNKDFEYDASHTIEYRNGDTWVDKTVARIDWVLDVYTVHPNETSDIVATTQGFDTAALGIYRIRYDFKVDGNTYNSWVIFEIKENEEKDEWGGDTTHPGGTDVHDAFDIRISWANWLDGTIVDEGCLNFDQLAISSVHHIPLHKFSSRSELDAFKARFGEDNSFDYGYNGKSFNENTADYDDAFFEENDLFLVYVDANSGSFSFDVNNIFNDGKSFGIYVNQTNNPEDVTDDMAGWFITVAVPKSATENCTLFDAIMGFPPCIDSNDMVDAVILKDGFTFKESWIDSNNELTESKTFVVESQEALNEIFTEFKDVNFDKEMVIVYCYTTIYIREHKLEKVSFDNNILSIEFDVVDGKPGTGDATAPQTRTCVICLDKVAATEVKVTYNGQ